MLTIGVDVAKATLEAAAWRDGHAVRLGAFEQMLAGWTALRDAVMGLQTATASPGPATDHELVALVVEPTGGFELAFALWVRQQPGWQVHRPNPARVRAWARSQGVRAKTDRQDAVLLAHLAANAQPPLPVWQPLASAVSELEQLLRRRDEVADWLQRERRRHEQLGVRPAASATVRESVERLLKTLEDELADLERAGVQLDGQGAIVVDASLRTNVPHIWAAGDVIGREAESQMATPVGAHDGGIAASNALAGANRRVDHTVIPRAIFTDPQVGVVGLTDREAKARGFVCQCNTIPLSVVPRAGAICDTRGVIKMVLERPTRRVLGVSMVGMNAAEVIHEAAMALRFGATADDFIDLVHVYPTMAEALKIAAISFTKDVSRLSCCAS
jgi:hypothetical protein